MNKSFIIITMAALSLGAVCFVSCSKSDLPSESSAITDTDTTNVPTEPTPSRQGYHEQYRPQIHYSPAKNWVNDPNGMVYVDGTWHLYYQYNPYGNDWGNMSWGHATSTDLIHWKEQKVAITKTDLGDIFSGSCIVDKDNVAGFGKNAIIAYYTAASQYQQQAMAYSTDGGATFVQYSGNAVIPSTQADFRDQKVTYYEPAKKWIMSLATGNNHTVEFWSSTNLKSWTQESTFTIDNVNSNKGQWECPDLIKMGDQWVLLVNVNPGGPTLGSACMYFVGQFDGKNFTVNSDTYPKWVDYGMDNYAEVTWNNAPDGRLISISWMNNWQYAGAVPCTPWRSAFSLPKELALTEYNGEQLLTSKVVGEISKIAGEWKTISDGNVGTTTPYELEISLPAGCEGSITLSNDAGQMVTMDVSSSSNSFAVHRNSKTGIINFGNFSLPSIKAPLFAGTGEMTFDFYVDNSSVEVIGNDGRMVQTNLFFPQSIYNKVSISGMNGLIKARTFSSIWGNKNNILIRTSKFQYLWY